MLLMCGGNEPMSLDTFTLVVCDVVNMSSTDAFLQDQTMTPLHYAACYNKSDIMKMLVEKGADVNVKDKVS